MPSLSYEDMVRIAPPKLVFAGLVLLGGVSGCQQGQCCTGRSWLPSCNSGSMSPPMMQGNCLDYSVAPSNAYPWTSTPGGSTIPGGSYYGPAYTPMQPTPSPQIPGPPAVPPAPGSFQPRGTVPSRIEPVPQPGPTLQPGLSPDGFNFSEPIETERQSIPRRLGSLPNFDLKSLGDKIPNVFQKKDAHFAPSAAWSTSANTVRQPGVTHPSAQSSQLIHNASPEIYQFSDHAQAFPAQTPRSMSGQHQYTPAPQQPLDLTPHLNATPRLDPLSAQGPSFTPETYQQTRYQSQTALAIPRLALCREVRSYEDIVEVDAFNLRAGQSVLIYATLDNFQSRATPEGFRTLTLSTLEVKSRTGAVITKQTLGSANDLSRSQRRDYYLTHQIVIPAELPAGDYLFTLSVYDLIGREWGQAEIAVRVHGGS